MVSAMIEGPVVPLFCFLFLLATFAPKSQPLHPLVRTILLLGSIEKNPSWSILTSGDLYAVVGIPWHAANSTSTFAQLPHGILPLCVCVFTFCFLQGQEPC